MTGELILFEGHEVRTVDEEGDVWMPIYDLSLAWGLDRTTIPKHIERNDDFFEGCTRLMDILSHDGRDTESQLCVNEEGLYLLLARMSKGKVKNPMVKASITRFRKMVPKLIRAYRQKEILPAEPQQPLIKDELDRAKLLAEATGGRLQEFQKIALEICGYGKYARALDVPEITHGKPGWYNPTQLAAMIGDVVVTAERVNHFLKNKGYQYRDTNNLWRLTAEGFVHGREYIFESPGGHREPRIAWRESILYASGLKRPVDESQLALPARA